MYSTRLGCKACYSCKGCKTELWSTRITSYAGFGLSTAVWTQLHLRKTNADEAALNQRVRGSSPWRCMVEPVAEIVLPRECAVAGCLLPQSSSIECGALLLKEMALKRIWVTGILLSCGSAVVVGQDQPQAFVGAHIIPIEGDAILDGVLIVHRGKIIAGGLMTSLPPTRG